MVRCVFLKGVSHRRDCANKEQIFRPTYLTFGPFLAVSSKVACH
jgi:hypothetical protein